MAITHKTKMDIKKTHNPFNAVTPLFNPVFVQYDQGILKIELSDGPTPYEFASTDTVEFTHVLPDGKVITYPGEIIKENHKTLVTYRYRGSEMAQLGRVQTGFTVLDAERNKVSIQSFDVVIEKDIRDAISSPANPEKSLIDTIISDLDRLKSNPGGISQPGPPGEKGDPFKFEDFTNEQLELLKGPTGSDANIDVVLRELEIINEELNFVKNNISLESEIILEDVENNLQITAVTGFYGFNSGLFTNNFENTTFTHIRIDVNSIERFKITSDTGVIGEFRAVFLIQEGMVLSWSFYNIGDIVEVPEGCNFVSCNFQTTIFGDGSSLSISEIKSTERNIIKNNKELKILMLGNSFSLDALNFLYEISRSAGIKVVLGISYDANGGLAGTWNKIQNNAPTDSYHKWNENGYVIATNRTLNSVVSEEDWDIITYQQVSSSSGNYTSFQPSLNNVHNYVKGIAKKPNVKFGLHMTWAYATGSSNLSDSPYSTQEEMYQAITTAYSQAMTAMNFDILIPSGTAIQIARTVSNLKVIGNDLTRDGYHLNEGVGRYIAALTVFETLLAPHFKKDLHNDVSYFPTNNGNTRYLSYLAKNVAKNAVLKPFGELGYTNNVVQPTIPNTKFEWRFNSSTNSLDLVLLP